MILFWVDLTQVVNQWIGETENHLPQVFAVAKKENGAIFFDEADALLGKRTKVHDA